MTGGGYSTTKVVQITNIAPQCTKDQMMSLFGSIGKIDEIRLYPTIRDVSCPVFSRICYIKFLETSSVVIAQHLTNTVFIDRALIVCPVLSGNIPDEFKALEMTNNGNSVPGSWSDSDMNLPADVVNRIEGTYPNQVIRTYDPKLEENNLPEYPPLPANVKKIEEIRRTITVLDVRSDWHLDELMDHFGSAGEVKYATRADKGRDRFVIIEFCEQKSVVAALMMQGTEYKGDLLNVYHSMQAINKPEAKSNEAAQREIEEAMSIVKEAQNMNSAAIDPVIGMLSKDKSSSSRRSRSRSRRRSRSRSKSTKRSRSRSKRSRSKTRSKRSRSRSRSRKSRSKRNSPARKQRSKSRSKRSRSKRSRSRSKEIERRRSRERSKRSRSKSSRWKRSRSKERRKRSRSRHKTSSLSSRRSRSRSRRSRSRSRDHRKTSRKDDRHRRSRSRSKSKRRSHSKSRSSRPSKEQSRSSKRRSRASRTPERSSKLRRLSEERVTRDYDEEEKIGMEETFRPPEPPAEKSTSPEKSDNMDISNSP